jgi:hypothetical protein
MISSLPCAEVGCTRLAKRVGSADPGGQASRTDGNEDSCGMLGGMAPLSGGVYLAASIRRYLGQFHGRAGSDGRVAPGDSPARRVHLARFP